MAKRASLPCLTVLCRKRGENYYDVSALQCGFVFETGEEFLKVMDTDLFSKTVMEMNKVNVHPLDCSFVGGMRHVIGKKPRPRSAPDCAFVRSAVHRGDSVCRGRVIENKMAFCLIRFKKPFQAKGHFYKLT